METYNIEFAVYVDPDGNKMIQPAGWIGTVKEITQDGSFVNILDQLFVTMLGFSREETMFKASVDKNEMMNFTYVPSLLESPIFPSGEIEVWVIGGPVFDSTPSRT